MPLHAKFVDGGQLEGRRMHFKVGFPDVGMEVAKPMGDKTEKNGAQRTFLEAFHVSPKP